VLTASLLACGADAPPPAGDAVAGWPTWGGDAGGRKYSPLAQIHRGNVRDLEVAWVHRSGDVADGREGRPSKGSFEATPVLDAGTLYYCSPLSRVFAVDAETGQERWVHDPGVDATLRWGHVCRGVALWRDAEAAAGARCGRRVFTGTDDARLIALDAADGRPCRDFGDAGQVDLHRGVGEHENWEYRVTSPPTVIGDVVAVGAMVADNQRLGAPSGVVRGFDARSGALRWAFDPVDPGVAPLPPAPDGSPRYHPGTANAWGVFSADPARDLLFVPTGNATPDFHGGHRRHLDHYTSSVVAIRGSTGEVVWSFQTVHHDLWDYDVAAQPMLADLEVDGVAVPAVVQATKMGHVFLLHRETGAPLYPVEERPVPQGGAPGDWLSPTQPFPTHPPPLQPERMGPEDAWGFTVWDRDRCRRRIEAARSEGIFTPPSLKGSIEYPSVAGGVNWGGIAFDPQRRWIVTNLNRVVHVVTLVTPETGGGPVPGTRYRALFPQAGSPFAAIMEPLTSPFGVPCNRPPWGTLVAVDLDRGEKVWEVPFGTTRDMAPWPFWKRFGLPSMGGPVVTAGGLVFIAASLDDYLRAFDVETGEELWRARLPAGGQATPMTYRLREGGRQYVVIAAGGHGTMGTRPGDSLIAYALP
jgi:quinoprotein glucose dehydrogenase